MKSSFAWSVAAALAVAIVVGPAFAAEPKAKEEAVTVELFAAMKAGEIEVKIIPNDATVANVIVTNKTKKALKIMLPAAFGARLAGANKKADLPARDEKVNRGAAAGSRPFSIQAPEGFAGLPVLAQINNNNPGGNNQQNQQFGGGFGGGMGGMGGGFGGGGFAMNVAPEKVVKVKVPCMCLEHGKPDPTPRVAYELVPISVVAPKPEIAQICAMLGRGEISQNLAQACAWHLMDGLSWEQLAALPKVKHLNGTSEPWFTIDELRAANRVVVEAGIRAKKVAPVSPGETPTAVKP
jgi:hypothetical protein